MLLFFSSEGLGTKKCSFYQNNNKIISSGKLSPCFDTETYLRSRHFSWDRYQILQTYMTMGGIPYYLSLLKPGESLVQNIDRLFFSPNGTLRTEFDELYNALFNQADGYINIVHALALHRNGLTRQQIIEAVKIEGGVLTKMLRNLERSNFILGYQHFGHKTKDVIYRLVDFYTLFYYHFIEGDRSQDERGNRIARTRCHLPKSHQNHPFACPHLRHHFRRSQSRGPQHLTKPSADGRPVWKLMF